VHPALIVVQRVGRNPVVEFVRVSDAACERLLETAESIFYLGCRQTETDGRAAAGGRGGFLPTQFASHWRDGC